MKKYNKIVLNIPHSSFNGIISNNGGWKPNANLINQAIKETDWHTDFLFKDVSNKRVVPCVFDYSRFYVDVERLVNDQLEKEGRGILYTDINGHKRTFSDSIKQSLLSIREEFINQICDEITDDTLLIDCHSFNNEVAPDIDICIGYNDDWSKPDEETIDGIIQIFEDAGYKVGINSPYSNSITPKKSDCYKSIMIEVNKKLYLRNGIEINVDTKYAPKLSSTIKKVYDFVLG